MGQWTPHVCDFLGLWLTLEIAGPQPIARVYICEPLVPIFEHWDSQDDGIRT